jgi:hypothetical protein
MKPRKSLINMEIAPPEHSSIDKAVLLGKERIVKCPRCASINTKIISQFGSTACKALTNVQIASNLSIILSVSDFSNLRMQLNIHHSPLL